MPSAPSSCPTKTPSAKTPQRRLDTNPLRVLDSKSKQDQEVVADAPSVLELLDDEDTAHFDGVKRHLDALDVDYVVDDRLVRGLDYYTRTLFELKITGDELGAQSTLIGGGRYDNMVQSLGHKKGVPAIGFAMGIERILALAGETGPLPTPGCYFAPMTKEAEVRALVLAERLRDAGIYCEVDSRGTSVKSMMRRADSMDSRLCLLLGDNELNNDEITVKDLHAGEQEEIAQDQLLTAVAARLAKPVDRAASEGAKKDG